MPHCLVEDTIGGKAMRRLEFMTFGRFDGRLTSVAICDVELDEIRVGRNGLSSVREEDISPVCLGDGVD